MAAASWPTLPRQMDDDLIGRIRRIRLVTFDFDGVFTDNTVYVQQDGIEAVRCWRGDGLGLQKLGSIGIVSAILSTERNPVVPARAAKLGIRCVHDCHDKWTELRSLVAELGVSLEETAFVGNDINDLQCLHAVGIPIVVADAHADVREHALYRTRTRGGWGAVREVCDMIHDVVVRTRGG